MPEFVRLIANRLSRIARKYGSAPRHATKLPANLSLLEGGWKTHKRADLSTNCEIRDISENGLGLLVPSIRLGNSYLTGDGRRLLVQVESAFGAISLCARPVRYEPYPANPGAGYLIGAEIIDISEADRQQFRLFLKRTVDALKSARPRKLRAVGSQERKLASSPSLARANSHHSTLGLNSGPPGIRSLKTVKVAGNRR